MIIHHGLNYSKMLMNFVQNKFYFNLIINFLLIFFFNFFKIFIIYIFYLYFNFIINLNNTDYFYYLYNNIMSNNSNLLDSCCNPENIPNILNIDELVYNTTTKKYEANTKYISLDEDILPTCNNLKNKIMNRNTNEILRIIQCNPTWYIAVASLYKALKLAQSFASRGRTGCCYKLLWETENGVKFISFNQLINLNRYRIRFNGASHIEYFMRLVLVSYKKHEKARKFLSTNRNYPYHQIVNYHNYKKVVNNTTVDKELDKNNKCCEQNKGVYIDWQNSRNILAPSLNNEICDTNCI